MLALPPVPPPIGWEHTLRLPRDHYVRLDSNDYSVHPSAVGRRVLIRADLDRVRVWCEGGLVADHDRIWARHQTISDPGHVKAARLLRQQRFALVRQSRIAGKNEPFRSFGIRNRTSPAWVATSRARDPFRSVTRVSARS
jgi:hypothetical protein